MFSKNLMDSLSKCMKGGPVIIDGNFYYEPTDEHKRTVEKFLLPPVVEQSKKTIKGCPDYKTRF